MTVGSILGLTVAYFSYRQYYPDLADELSHRPYSPRIGDESAGSILPVHDQSKNQRYDPPGAGRNYDSFELNGTVERPGPQRLREAWREHDESDTGEGRTDQDHSAGGSNH